jgi:hypothetical protein
MHPPGGGFNSFLPGPGAPCGAPARPHAVFGSTATTACAGDEDSVR